MKKETWWNKPMTRKNWLVLGLFSIGACLVELGYFIYARSIKNMAKRYWEQSKELIKKVKERF